MSRRVDPLEVEQLVDAGEDLLGVYSKGHHSAGAAFAGDPFLTAVGAYLREEMWFDDDEVAAFTAGSVAFETWRCVPTPVADGGERWSRFVAATPGTRGAFPVTVLRIGAQR